MLKGKFLVVVFLLSILFVGSAFALQPAGTKGKFWSTVPVTSIPSWTHDLIGGDFSPILECTEPLIIDRARLFLLLDFTPNNKGVFKAEVKFGEDETILSKLIKFSYPTNNPVTNVLWKVRIPNSLLGQIANKSVEIKVIPIPNKGTLNDVHFSTLKGKYTVAPEPISMVLVGVGIAGLPVAKRIRRFMSKG